MIGRQISHYRIVAELGSGGMGTVYRAEDTRLGHEVALKVAHAARVADPATRERLLDAARTVATLDHPHILPLLESGEAAGTVYIAMPLVEGGSLRDQLRAPMPPRRVMTIGLALARALAHAHERGVTHGDVKPDNVMLCVDGVLRLADFELEHGDGGVGGGLTATAEYVAPERLRGAAADASADLYALGVTLYELSVGTPPFADTPSALVRRAATEPPPPLPVSVPSRLAELIEALLAKTPSERPASAGVVVETLVALLPPETT